MSVSFDQGVRYTLYLTHATCVLLRLLVLLCLTFLFYIFSYSACISVCIYGALNDYPRGVEKTVHILLERKTIRYIVTWMRASQVFVSCRYNSKRYFYESGSCVFGERKPEPTRGGTSGWFWKSWKTNDHALNDFRKTSNNFWKIIISVLRF